MAGVAGGLRIGNRRNKCAICNAFVQRVLRQTRTRLAERFSEEAAQIRLQVEVEQYRQMLEDWDALQEGAR
jgi:hypothetical protein